jgi:hypothetical protein
MRSRLGAVVRLLVGAVLACGPAASTRAVPDDDAFRTRIEADWLRQAEAWHPRSVSVWSTSKLRGPTVPEVVTAEAVRHFIERGRLLAADLRNAGVDAGSSVRVFERAAVGLTRFGSTGSVRRASSPGPESAGPPTEAEAARRESNAEPAQGTLRELYLRVRWAMRRLAFRNPVLNFDRLLMVKRFGQETYPDVCLNHMPWVSRPGGDLCALTLQGPEAAPGVHPLLRGALGPGHVHGVDLSWDGERIVFGYAKARSDHPPEGWLDRTQSYRLRREEEPIHLFEIRTDGTGLRQLTAGEWSDLDPTYAPNGDIVFVSERCATSLQCNEYDKDETSCNLYTMRPDGSGIRRLSANKDGDYLPHTLDDGTIGYVRWEYHERGWAFIQSLWTVRPDGTQADAIFKQHFVNPWAIEDTRSIPGTGNTRLVSIAAGHHTLPAGPVVLLTPGLGINDERGLRIVTPDVLPPEGGMSGLPVREGGVRDRGGFYMHPWPLSETTFLVSYTYGTGKTGLGSEVDTNGYALYLIDVFGTKELLYRDPDISCFSPLPLRPRPRPPILPDLTVSHTRYATGVVSVVSFGCEGIPPESIRWLRLAEPVGWPYDNAHGGQRYGEDHRYGGPGADRKNLLNWTPVRILGDVPVREDGSAMFRVPADTAVYFQVLDENRMELRRMRSFISFQPGEQRACTGCHESRTVAPGPSPRTTSLALVHGADDPQPPPWGDRPVSFLRDVQPILDRHCTRCHCGLKPAGDLDFFCGLTSHDGEVPGYGYNRAYETILARGLVAMSAVRVQDAAITPPLAYGSSKSRLAQVVLRGRQAGRYAVTDDEWRTLTAWIDANAPYHDRFVNKRGGSPAYSLPDDRALHDRLAAVHERRCAGCHPVDEITRLDWIDFRDPDRALFLAAPLAPSVAPGETRPRCGVTVYRDRDDPDYRTVRELVHQAVGKAWSNPRRDLISWVAEEHPKPRRTEAPRSILP